MTKTQITVRVSPDTMVAIDAAVKASRTTRNHIIDRWLAAQAAATGSATPIEQQAWYRAGELAAKARAEADEADNAWYRANVPDALQGITNAIHKLADAIDVLAGTAPE